MMNAKRWRLLELLVIAGLIGTLFLPWLNDYSAASATTFLKETIRVVETAWPTSNMRLLAIVFVALFCSSVLLYAAAALLLLLSGVLVGLSGKIEKLAERRNKPIKLAKAMLIAEMITLFILCAVLLFHGSAILLPSWGPLATIGLMITEKKVRCNLERYEKYERRLHEKYPPDKGQSAYEVETPARDLVDRRWDHPAL